MSNKHKIVPGVRVLMKDIGCKGTVVCVHDTANDAVFYVRRDDNRKGAKCEIHNASGEVHTWVVSFGYVDSGQIVILDDEVSRKLGDVDELLKGLKGSLG